MHVTLDDRAVSPPDGFLIRKGPGNCYFDFAQEVSFTEPCTPRVAAAPSRPKYVYTAAGFRTLLEVMLLFDPFL